ncbi:hypothetical protein RV11_GL000524 [Enterococcus phoeniculicola]|jgi:hypothetical protein|uniref:Polymerase/histidinol phosphatase N-terminal domain-containing protein n=1 Tax=Enterococcus phoeniculicola ATCC BAA-412 TaxID=1158610 RepID=R3WWT5_9ENTE|nr:PHP domain-containing protein [Enterococcus phoeniculicola]EOL46240.1 hypothetical protein UC3_01046 [Enterococcus phoeniculicola ATCC BAA-412]EOT76915.1 hypothetical protein I589_01876 [Enterococcus phoeniculicola ATCC BAA-412]OJG71234.1 hypothetical protein RV11_GL000524 [Enterococcus phoeniculicola]
MKKLDLHIHTVRSISDSKKIDFSIEKLSEYIHEKKLDAIAITNHNIFDIEQFRKIREAIEVPVFPGVEVDLEKGHLLLIGDCSEFPLEDFATSCEKLLNFIKEQSDSLTLSEFYSVFPKHTLKKYLLIPHYRKSPEISERIIHELSENSTISAGEVSSPRKFMELKNEIDGLTPVLFSDQRICSFMSSFNNHQTYLNISEISLAAIKGALSDKTKVSLSKKDGKNLFEIHDGINASTGLNVLLGERSSGKTHLLNKINESTENTKYIRQFELVETDDKRSEETFHAQLQNDESMFSAEFLSEFNEIVKDILNIDVLTTKKNVNDYVQSLLKNAESTEKKDAFAKSTLFSEEKFKHKDTSTLEELIKATQVILENNEYSTLIDEVIEREQLVKLLLRLIKEHRRISLDNEIKEKANTIIGNVQSELSLKTTTQRILDIDLSKVAEEQLKIRKFNELTEKLQQEKILNEKQTFDFTVRKSKRKFATPRELIEQAKKRMSFSDIFSSYSVPFDFLQKLKSKKELEPADFYKYFVKIQVEILNKDLKPVSGGQRAEYNFLRKIEGALSHDMLLIDEPESSFDNPFLNTKINTMLKDISKYIPVFVSTHNNTIGGSISPDFILHTKRSIEQDKANFRVYTGYPTDKILYSNDGKSINNLSVQLTCLEAGESSYSKRSEMYEILKN